MKINKAATLLLLLLTVSVPLTGSGQSPYRRVQQRRQHGFAFVVYLERKKLYPQMVLDSATTPNWMAAIRVNSYRSYGTPSTELEYWLYNRSSKEYQGPMNLSAYYQRTAELDLVEELRLASWEEILRVDYKFSDPGYYSRVGGKSLYFWSDDPFSLSPIRVEKQREKYFDQKAFPRVLAPYTMAAYDLELAFNRPSPWLAKDGSCSWEIKYNRRNYFNNFYRDFGYGGTIEAFLFRADKVDDPNFQDWAREAAASLTPKEKQRYIYYAEQLQALQQAVQTGDSALQQQLEDAALLESERDYPCP